MTTINKLNSEDLKFYNEVLNKKFVEYNNANESLNMLLSGKQMVDEKVKRDKISESDIFVDNTIYVKLREAEANVKRIKDDIIDINKTFFYTEIRNLLDETDSVVFNKDKKVFETISNVNGINRITRDYYNDAINVYISNKRGSFIPEQVKINNITYKINFVKEY